MIMSINPNKSKRDENSLSPSEKSSDDDEYEKKMNSENLTYMLGEDLTTFILLEDLSGRKIKHSRLRDSGVSTSPKYNYKTLVNEAA